MSDICPKLLIFCVNCVAIRNFSVTVKDMNLLNDRNIDKFFGESEKVVRWEKNNNFMQHRRKHNMGIRKDCFAYRIGRCNIMTEMICRRENCSFFKTKEEMERDREKYGFVKDYKPKGERK